MAKGMAVLALVVVLAVGACGDDDSDEADNGDGTTDSTEQDAGDATDETNGNDETSEPEAPAGEGYTEQIRTNFMTACAAQAGATEAQCECTFDEIAAAVPIEEFTAYDQAVRQDPGSPPPSWLTTAVTACS
jgi:hypothetical protein